MSQSQPEKIEPRWLEWAKELHSVAHNGLLYVRDPYDRERYEQVLRIAAEMMAAQSGSNDLRPVLDLLTQDAGYITPKVDVRAAVFQEDRILLVRELQDEGRWTLPGGWADPNDAPSKAAEREVREETGYKVVAERVLAVFDRSQARHGHYPPHPLHSYKIFFLCKLVGGTAEQSHETGESRFFAEGDLPVDLSVARVTLPQLQRIFAQHRNAELAADFD